MNLFLQVEPARSEESGKGLAFLDPAEMERHQIALGDVIEIENASDRTVLARVAPPRKEDRGSGFLRIDQFLRQPIKVLIGDRVEVRKIVVGQVKKMVLAPLLDVSQISGLEAYLAQVFAAQGLPVAVGGVLYATLPGAAGGTAFKVLEVLPGPGLVVPGTQVELKFIFTIWPGMASEVSFEDVGGLSQQIQTVRELVELPLRHPDTYRHLGISPPRGIIFYGPPGTGKTLLVRAMAHELKAQFLYVSGPEVVGSVYGESESNLRKVFHEASHHLPSIILIDELDAIISKRGESGSQADTRMTTQLLELMDGLKEEPREGSDRHEPPGMRPHGSPRWRRSSFRFRLAQSARGPRTDSHSLIAGRSALWSPRSVPRGACSRYGTLSTGSSSRSSSLSASRSSGASASSFSRSSS